MPTTAIRLTFSDIGDFVAESHAVSVLEEAGFSVGRMQAHAPRGILFGLYDIQKWKNLNAEHRRALHGIMTGNYRNGPVTVEIFDSALEEAKTALRACERVSSERRFAPDEVFRGPFEIAPSQVLPLAEGSTPVAALPTFQPSDLHPMLHTQDGQFPPSRQQKPSCRPSEGKL